MKTATAFYVVVLCVGTITAFEVFAIFDREPGDRPIFINTLLSNVTEEVDDHIVSYEWFGVNETFTQIYVETPSDVERVSIHRPESSTHPQYQRTFRLEIAATNTTTIHVNFIVFGFVNQPLIKPGANISLLGLPVNMAVERIDV